MLAEPAGSLVAFLSESASGLFCEAGGFHIDPWQPVERALITHAHGDHARPGSAAYLCAAPSEALLRRRLGSDIRIESIPYGVSMTIGGVRVSFHPAGHVLGSAQIRLDSAEGVWVVAGDYKRAADPTCAPFEPVACDTFITESTFGLPIYRWDDTRAVVDDIAGVVERQCRNEQDLAAVLLHAREGAAAARGAHAGHGPTRVRARDDARDDRGLPRRRRRHAAGPPGDRTCARVPLHRRVVCRRTGAGASVGARHAVGPPAR